MAKMKRLHAVLKEPLFTSGEVRDFLDIPLPRFQDWLGRKIFPFTEVEQGKRRLVRMFSAYDVLTLSIAVILMDQHGLEPSEAADIADKALLDIAGEVFARDWEQQPNCPESVKGWRPMGYHNYWAIAGGKPYPLFASSTIGETATEITKSESFIVIDMKPLKKRATDFVLPKVEEKLREAAARE